MTDDKPSVWDYDASDSLSRTSPHNYDDEEYLSGSGLYVRCAYCKTELGLYLIPCRNQEGEEYETVFRHEEALRSEAPFFCDDGEDSCWEKLEHERQPNLGAITNW